MRTMPEMAQFMISMPQRDKDRMDALRVVLGTSRAEIGRRAVEVALNILEEENSERIARLHEVARKAGYANYNGFIRDLTAPLAGVAGPRQVLPTLEQLEDPNIYQHVRRRTPEEEISKLKRKPARGATRKPEIPRQAGPTEAERAPDETDETPASPLFSG